MYPLQELATEVKSSEDIVERIQNLICEIMQAEHPMTEDGLRVSLASHSNTLAQHGFRSGGPPQVDP